MKPMGTIYDLIEEAKLRTVWWALCVFTITYFLTHTSKSMWMNIPMAILLVCGLRILLIKVDFRWKVQPPLRSQTYLAHLEKKQLSVNDSRISTVPSLPKWKRKIDSPVVEAAINKFINQVLKDFVIDLWYGEITPDREAPEHMRSIVMDALGEVSARVREINLVDLLTRDMVDLVGDHIDLFRRNQAAIGVDVMVTLSSEERDERLKHHLMASRELHPALFSPESEYKVLQRLMGGVLALVLRPRESQSPVVRSIARELLTCLVMQPIMNLASPGYINELLESILLIINDGGTEMFFGNPSTIVASHNHSPSVSNECREGDSAAPKKTQNSGQRVDMILAKTNNDGNTSLHHKAFHEESSQPRPADWARMLEAATQRRTEVLMPENLENMWTKGRNYKKKEKRKIKAGIQDPLAKTSTMSILTGDKILGKEITNRSSKQPEAEGEDSIQLKHGLNLDNDLSCDGSTYGMEFSQHPDKESSLEKGHLVGGLDDAHKIDTTRYAGLLRRSNSTSDLLVQPDKSAGPFISEFYSPNFERHSGEFHGKSASDMVIRREGQQNQKLRCRVMGAYFEKLGSKSFAVYSIAVTDAENRTWFVKRRFSNFERLHRQLKDIPNYTLHLPPKRFLASSTEDTFVHQRCIQLDKYLQDLLTIANVAEQHEVWDFLSVSSKNYAFGKTSSVMRTLAVNVDDAVDDIVRQFKGVSDGLMRKVVGSPSLPHDFSASTSAIQNLSQSCYSDGAEKTIQTLATVESANSFSDNEEHETDEKCGHEEVDRAEDHGWHSDNELSANSYPPRVVKRERESLVVDKRHDLVVKSGTDPGVSEAKFTLVSNHVDDPVGMPPEWMPPNVSVPLLNLVDKIFQLKRRGWLRRQVFWISKQILHLIMDDAIDDWLLRQIHWLRREDVVAQGIQWLQDVLWPGGTFFLKVGSGQMTDGSGVDLKSLQTMNQSAGSRASKPGSFEEQLEATRRASDIKKMLYDGAPMALVSLVGHKQYRRCARDIYYFTQSSICVRQLAYAILELLLVSIFPELRSLILDVHDKMHVHQPV